MTRQNNGAVNATNSQWNYGENNIDIDGNQSYLLGLTIGDTPVSISSSVVTTNCERLVVYVYEDEDFNGGSPYILFNKNRVTTAIPVFQLDSNVNSVNPLNPVIPVSEETIRATPVDDDEEVFAFKEAGGESIQNRWVLKPFTKYIIRFRNRTNRNNRKVDANIVFDELFYAKET